VSVPVDKLETSLPFVWELRPRVIYDVRGFFMETYQQAAFAELGIMDTFVQDNHSQSTKGTLRGLHYQLHHPQAKLCRTVEGEVLDVAVDIRLGSPYFGKWTSVLLSAKTHNQVYIPPGFAHGYVALTESVQFLYKCSDFYEAADEHGIVWNDPDLGIAWSVQDPLVSRKDAKHPILSAIPPELLPKYTTAAS
jgi:dTDP-4-dehydrorhamnose 3,5-epimerase